MSGPCARRCGRSQVVLVSVQSRRAAVLPASSGSNSALPVRCGADPRPVLRTEVEDGQIWLGSPRVCERLCRPARLACARRVPACGFDVLIVGSVRMGCDAPWRWWPRILGLLVEGSTPDENHASTLSSREVAASTDVVFLLGGTALELVLLFVPHGLCSTGENLRFG